MYVKCKIRREMSVWTNGTKYVIVLGQYLHIRSRPSEEAEIRKMHIGGAVAHPAEFLGGFSAP